MDYSPSGSSVHAFSRQEYWSGLPFPFPGDLPNPGIEPGSPALQEDSLTFEPLGKHRQSLGNKNDFVCVCVSCSVASDSLRPHGL